MDILEHNARRHNGQPPEKDMAAGAEPADHEQLEQEIREQVDRHAQPDCKLF